MEQKAFEKIVVEGFERLPEWVRKKIANVALLVEDEPSEEVRKEEDLGEDETLLGLYHGIPLLTRGEYYGVGGTLPDTITLYRLPIEDAAKEDEFKLNLDPEEAIRKVVVETIWHEFAHHFGMNEHEVRLREKERDGPDED